MSVILIVIIKVYKRAIDAYQYVEIQRHRRVKTERGGRETREAWALKHRARWRYFYDRGGVIFTTEVA